jgi:O-acetyl-ADP-ribose deacetylase (regulator of RNase III)
MIEFVSGNVFESGCEALVNPVNCGGVMGAGLAQEFKRYFPQYFFRYKIRCARGHIQPGWVDGYGLSRKDACFPGVKAVISFPTKNHWSEDSKLTDIDRGLQSLAETIEDWGFTSVAVPALGCGKGGLKWADVKALIEKHLAPLSNILIKVYAPHGELRD